ncbi:MAG: TPM domain-containing protein, partial [Bacteroidia bacterium]
MTKFHTVKILFFFFGLFLSSSFFLEAKEFPKLIEGKRVYDLADVLSSDEELLLEKKIVAYQDSTSSQIVILIEESLEGEDDFGYTQRLAEEWGIGQANKNNGILIAAFISDRRLRIQVGRGLEPVITDAISHEIIEKILKPAFRQQAYYEGFDKSLDAVFLAAKGEFTGDGRMKKAVHPGLALLIPLIAIILIFLLARRGGGGGGMGGFMGGYLAGRMLGGGFGNFSSGRG